MFLFAIYSAAIAALKILIEGPRNNLGVVALITSKRSASETMDSWRFLISFTILASTFVRAKKGDSFIILSNISSDLPLQDQSFALPMAPFDDTLVAAKAVSVTEALAAIASNTKITCERKEKRGTKGMVVVAFVIRNFVSSLNK